MCSPPTCRRLQQGLRGARALIPPGAARLEQRQREARGKSGLGRAEGPCDTLDQGLAGLGCPSVTGNEQNMALKSQKPIYCLRGFAFHLQLREKQPSACGGETWLPRKEETFEALRFAEETEIHNICLKPAVPERSCSPWSKPRVCLELKGLRTRAAR